MTVYEYAQKLMEDQEFNAGGIPEDERKCLDAVGFKYVVEHGEVAEFGKDAEEFYAAMNTLVRLQKKYKKV